MFPTFPLTLMWACGEVNVLVAGHPFRERVVHVRHHQCSEAPRRGMVPESHAPWVSTLPALSFF
jgi:hypothetical protein